MIKKYNILCAKDRKKIYNIDKASFGKAETRKSIGRVYIKKRQPEVAQRIRYGDSEAELIQRAAGSVFSVSL